MNGETIGAMSRLTAEACISGHLKRDAASPESPVEAINGCKIDLTGDPDFGHAARHASS